MIAIPDLDAGSYRSHALHDDGNDWPETNCYVDVWVEVLHALGFDPIAGLSFVLRSGFDGEQWEFFKYQTDDLWSVYGISVREMNVWRPLAEHIEIHLAAGRLVTMEADSWFLPDTAGVAYRFEHQKSSIVPWRIDRDGRQLGYFHNRGYYVLSGDDFDGVMRTEAADDDLPPYVELVDLPQEIPSDETTRVIARQRVVDALERRSSANQITQLAQRVILDVDWLRTEPPTTFHLYAFATLRQCGAWAACAAALAEWLGTPLTRIAATEFTTIAQTAKTCQFQLARAARGRDVDLAPSFDAMERSWERAYDLLTTAYHT